MPVSELDFGYRKNISKLFCVWGQIFNSCDFLIYGKPNPQ